LLDTYFSLHKEFVILQSTSPPHAILCPSCFPSAKKGELPEVCVATGYDYGNYDALPGWEDLTDVEELMIARYVPQISLFKLSLKGKTSASSDQLGLKGHVIVFSHSGLPNLEASLGDALILPRQSVDEFIAVTFIGKASFTDISSTIRSTRTFLISKKRIIYALKLLKDVNPFYHNICIDETWDEDEIQDSIHDEILSSMRVTQDDAVVALEDFTSSNTAADVQPSPPPSSSKDAIDYQAVMVSSADGGECSTSAFSTPCKAFVTEALAAFGNPEETLANTADEEVLLSYDAEDIPEPGPPLVFDFLGLTVNSPHRRPICTLEPKRNIRSASSQITTRCCWDLSLSWRGVL
jgi:hypothetical protein